MSNYIEAIPKPLLDDIINNQCIPIIGAGFSRNADLPNNLKMPLWEDLGKYFAKQMKGFEYSGPIDAISTYCHEYSKPKAVEILSEILFIDTARPGNVYDALSDLKFDILITTNFDFLLEKAYENKSKNTCVPIIGEDQLSVNMPSKPVRIIKLHGDLNHPDKLILTEEEFDTFLTNNPLMSTYISNLLITKTPLFIGYSLDDPDFRGIWQIISSRLGKMRRNAYALTVGIENYKKKKYERRGIKVIDIKKKGKSYKKVLELLFIELKEYWDSKISEVSSFSDSKSKAELSLPPDIKTGLCFFAIPFNLLSFYRENIFPVFKDYGFTPITAADMITPGDNIAQKIPTLIERADLVYVDLDTSNTLYELNFALNKNKNLIIVLEDNIELPDILNTDYVNKIIIRKPRRMDSEKINDFVNNIEDKVAKLSKEILYDLPNESKRLLEKEEHRAAVIMVFSLFENELREKFRVEFKGKKQYFKSFFPSLSQMLGEPKLHRYIGEENLPKMKEWIRKRNRLIHSRERITKSKANEIVKGVLKIVENIRNK